MDGAETAVEWRAFGTDAFAAAREAGRPVLLSMVTPWCRSCRRLDEAVYGDPAVAGRIEGSFVPVRVDADRRPRVRDRYNMGGFPTTTFLTPGGEVLTGATGLDAAGIRSVLDRVLETWEERGTDAGRIPRGLRTTPPAGEVTPAIERLVAGQLRERFDPDHGGWGREAKFPLPRTVEFALKREPELATRTLDPIRQHLLDTYDGGFFRYAGNRDWSDPHRAKLAGENAALLRAFANAYLHAGDDAYRETAAGVVGFLTTTLWTGDAVAGSQAPADPDHYRRSAGEREAADDPPVDPTAFAGRNALAADALLVHRAYTDDGTAGRYAERILAYTERELLDDGVVLHHDAPDAPRGLLADQARVARAFARAAQVLDPAHAGTGRAVADHALEALWTEDGFADGPREGPGLLDRPLYDIEASAAFADALLDLAALSGEERYRDAARDALAAFAGAEDRMGVQVAGYASAASRLLSGLRIEVATPPGSDLHRAALRVADHEKTVVPDADREPGTATVIAGGEAAPPAGSPPELEARVAEVAE